MILRKKDVTKHAWSLQVSAGQEAAAEVAVYVRISIFADIYKNGVLLLVQRMHSLYKLQVNAK